MVAELTTQEPQRPPQWTNRSWTSWNGESLVFHSPNKHKFFNPAGLCIHLIKENAMPPEQPA